MPTFKFSGPCIVCGKADNRYRKQMCRKCYRKNHLRETNLRLGKGPLKFSGPCSNCNGTTSAKNRWVHGMCRKCYRRIDLRGSTLQPRSKFNGPCEKCGLVDPAKEFTLKLCSKCYKWHRNNTMRDNANRRARVAGAISELTDEQWIRVLEHFKYRCAYCDKDIRNKFTLDHVVPLSKGGSHTIDNVVPACLSCNSGKADRLPPRPVVTLKE